MPRRRSWGTGSVFPPGKYAATWSVRWREGGRKRFQSGFDSGAEARAWLDRRRVENTARRLKVPLSDRRAGSLSAHVEDWLRRREVTHESWSKDRGRWRLHLEPVFGDRTPSSVDHAAIRAFVERMLRAKVGPTTIRLCVALLSTIYTDLAERPHETGVTLNPVRGLPKSVRRLYKHKPPPRRYVRKASDVRRLFLSLPPPLAVGYALGALGGMRTGEILALEWPDVSTDGTGRIEVTKALKNGRVGLTKDREARVLTGEWLASLTAVLRPWRLITGGRGLLIPPEMTRTHGRARCSSKHTTPQRLYAAWDPERLGLPALDFYEATRHTFASHWARDGRGLAELALILGHSATWVTERYAHPDLHDYDGVPLLDPATWAEVGQSLAGRWAGNVRKING